MSLYSVKFIARTIQFEQKEFGMNATIEHSKSLIYLKE